MIGTDHNLTPPPRDTEAQQLTALYLEHSDVRVAVDRLDHKVWGRSNPKHIANAREVLQKIVHRYAPEEAAAIVSYRIMQVRMSESYKDFDSQMLNRLAPLCEKHPALDEAVRTYLSVHTAPARAQNSQEVRQSIKMLEAQMRTYAGGNAVAAQFLHALYSVTKKMMNEQARMGGRS